MKTTDLVARLRELVETAPVGSEYRSDWEPWLKKRDALARLRELI